MSALDFTPSPEAELFGAEERAWDRIYATRDSGRLEALLAGERLNYSSDSEADRDLEVILLRAFGDPAKVKEIMEASPRGALRRGKWHEGRGAISFLEYDIRRALTRARMLGPYKVPDLKTLVAWDSKEAAEQRTTAEVAAQQQQPLRLLTLAELQDPSLLKVPDAIGPWLTWRGELTYFPGREKLGKSSCAASDARGIAAAGSRFLWLTAEESRGRVVKRLRDLGIPLAAMLVPDRWPRSWDEVEALITAEQPDAVYVDSLASYLAGVGERIPDTSEGEAWHGLMLRFKRWTTVGRQIDSPAAGVCVLEHGAKESGQYRGSTGKAAAADVIVTFLPVTGDERARRLDVLGRWGFPSRSVRFVSDEAGYEDVRTGRPSGLDDDAAKVIEAYEPGISTAQWREATGLSQTTFYRARREAMETRPDGTWVARSSF